MTIRHVVSWRLAADDTETRAEHFQGVISRLQALDGVVPSIRSLSVGANVAYPEANWDIALVADFDDAAGLEAYQVHPAHQEVVTYVKAVVSARAAVDFEL